PRTVMSWRCDARAPAPTPPRRSSDLGFDEDVVPVEDLDPEPPGPSEPKARVTPAPGRKKAARSGGGGRKPLLLAGGAVAALALRSEEHTSELQSRENLVCRLLLEKTN